MMDAPRELAANRNQEPCRLPLHFATSVRRLASARNVSILAILALLVAVSPMASARNTERHKHPRLHAIRHMLLNVGLPGLGFIPDDDELDVVPEDGQKYEIKLARQGGEIIDVVYRVGDTYIPEALDKLSQFLHDTHNEEVKTYDPRTFDVLHTMLAKLGRSSSVIEILSGYRTKVTNDELRASGATNAAEHSQHIEAKALDIRVPGIPAVELRDAALSLGAGGVGYYPKSQFIHVDTGPVREWTFAPHRSSRSGLRSRHRRRA
jgi:uncharacterized protein YcbK (DUF882 family)